MYEIKYHGDAFNISCLTTFFHETKTCGTTEKSLYFIFTPRAALKKLKHKFNIIRKISALCETTHLFYNPHKVQLFDIKHKVYQEFLLKLA